jgi:hypothetical protein
MTGDIDLFISEIRIPMIEKLPELLQSWSERWGKLVLAPSSHFRDANGRSVPDATLFLLGNEILAYLALNITAITYFALFYRSHLVGQIKANAKSGLESSLIIFPVYVLVSLGILLVAATASFAVYRSLKTSTGFSTHLVVFLDLSLTDIPAAIGITLVLLGDHWRSVISLLGLAVFLVARLWRLWLGFRAMDAVYSPTKKEAWWRFIFGFLATDLFFGSSVVGAGFLLLVFIVGIWD